MVDDLVIAAEPFDSDDARRLIAELDGGLAQLYTPEQRFGPNFNAEQIAGGRGAFLIARVEARAVGCGAIRVLDGTTAEVKRMYVQPELRGRRVGRAVLGALEEHARGLGVRCVMVPRHAERAGGLRRGQSVTVRGRCDGKGPILDQVDQAANVELRECYLITVNK